MTTRLILLLVALLTGCVAPPIRVDTPRTEALDKSYVVDLPVGWIKQWTPDKDLIVSRDGYLLETIGIAHRPLDKAYPRTKKVALETALPSELAELEIAELKAANEQLAALKVLENDPALLAGKEGYRLKVAYKNQRGLEYQRVVYGVADKAGYFSVGYFAPTLYYFDKYDPDFQRVVESFQLIGAPGAAKK